MEEGRSSFLKLLQPCLKFRKLCYRYLELGKKLGFLRARKFRQLVSQGTLLRPKLIHRVLKGSKVGVHIDNFLPVQFNAL